MYHTAAVNDPAFWPTFDSIDGAITQFVGSLPAVDCETFANEEEALDASGTGKAGISPSLVLAHTAAHGAVVQLHRMFSQNDAGSYRRCLAAANEGIKVLKEGVVVGKNGAGVKISCLPMQLGVGRKSEHCGISRLTCFETQIIWTCVAEVLAAEYERLKRRSLSIKEVESELTMLFDVMKNLRTVFPILSESGS